MGRVVCTHDRDFLRLASQGIAHAGIVWGEQDEYSIGDWVRYVRLVHGVYDANEMLNEVFFLVSRRLTGAVKLTSTDGPYDAE